MLEQPGKAVQEWIFLWFVLFSVEGICIALGRMRNGRRSDII